MPTPRPDGLVFISYARVDRARIEPLVEELKGRFNIFWDKDLRAGDPWLQVVDEQLSRARCVLALWTNNVNATSFVMKEVDFAIERGVLVPVKLDPHMRVPVSCRLVQFETIENWPGAGPAGLDKLFAAIDLQLRNPRPAREVPSLAAAPQAVKWTLKATADLDRLTTRVGTIGGILMIGQGPVDDLLASLREIDATYGATLAAIDAFLVPDALGTAATKRRYQAIERGSLIQLIDQGRGHCSRIAEHYLRAGGIREWLKSHAKPAVLKSADQAFRRLSTADNDLFDHLARIGKALTAEASALVGLLLGQQQALARRRIVDGREKLLPLVHKLTDARSRMSRINAELGYVPTKPTRAPGGRRALNRA